MAFIMKQLRIVIIVMRNFTKNKLQLQAAGLTYYTLLSVVPVVALVFAISKGFGFQATLERELLIMMKGHEDIAEQIMVFAARTLENTKGGLLAGVGVVVLLWSVMTLLSSIELSFNDIWHVAKGRSWIRKFTEYFSIMLVAPVLIFMISGLTVVVSFIEDFVQGIDFLQAIGPYIFLLIRFIPYALVWLLFTFVYMIMPNTKVNFGSALIAGIIAGTAFELVQWGYIHFQVGVSKYNAIYGSFAALPMFLIWANLSWLITLIGAEVAYANQYILEIEREVEGNRMSVQQQYLASMAICKSLSINFESGGDPLSASKLSRDLMLPFGITTKALEILVNAKLITEIDFSENQPNAYLPARSYDKLSFSELVKIINNEGKADLDRFENGPFQSLVKRFDLWQDKSAGIDENILIKDFPIHQEKV
jgi:membrane protein